MVSHWVKFTVVFVIASGLLLTGFFLSWYPSSVIEGLKMELAQGGLTQLQTDWYQGSLSWWQNQGLFLYGSAANFVLAGGVLALVYAIVYVALSAWRESIRAKVTLERKQYASQAKVDKPARRTTRTGFPIAAGVLSIISSSVAMLFALLFIGAYMATFNFRYPTSNLNLLADGVFGVAAFAFGLAGGIMTLKRKNFVFALLGPCFLIAKGATLIVATGGDTLGVLIGSTVLALTILSLIFVSISYKEFY
jgi:hypothetical protein